MDPQSPSVAAPIRRSHQPSHNRLLGRQLSALHPRREWWNRRRADCTSPVGLDDGAIKVLRAEPSGSSTVVATQAPSIPLTATLAPTPFHASEKIESRELSPEQQRYLEAFGARYGGPHSPFQATSTKLTTRCRSQIGNGLPSRDQGALLSIVADRSAGSHFQTSTAMITLTRRWVSVSISSVTERSC